MEKRTLKQFTVEEKLEKLRIWREDHPEWTPTVAGNELGVSKGTLLGWRKQFSVGNSPNPALQHRVRLPGGGRKHQLARYELDVLRYYDERAQEGHLMNNAELLKHCKEIRQFAELNDNTQKTWVHRFIKRYKPTSATATSSAATPVGDLEAVSTSACVEPPLQTPLETPVSQLPERTDHPGVIESTRSTQPLKVTKAVPAKPTKDAQSKLAKSSKALHKKSVKITQTRKVKETTRSKKRSSSEDSDSEFVPSDHSSEAKTVRTSRAQRSRRATKVHAAIVYSYPDVHEPHSDEPLIGHVFAEDIKSLQPHQHVTNLAVDFVITTHLHKRPDLVWAFHSSFFTDLQAQFDQQRFARTSGPRSGNFDIWETPFLFIPILDQRHWSFLLVETPVEEDFAVFHHIDSFPGIHVPSKIFDVMEWYFGNLKQLRSAKQSLKFPNQAFTYLTQPLQSNSADCGIYMLFYMKLLYRKIKAEQDLSSIRNTISSCVSGLTPSQADMARSQLLKAMEKRSKA